MASPDPPLDCTVLLADPQASSSAADYLRHLSSLSLATAQNEPGLLAEEEAVINEDLMQLCLDESLTFKHAHAYLRDFGHATQQLISRTQAIRDHLPAVRSATGDFLTLANRVEQQRRVAQTAQDQLDRVGVLLELPAAVKACVKDRRFQEAIDLTLQSRQLLSGDVIGQARDDYPAASSNPLTAPQLASLICSLVEDEFERAVALMVDGLGQTSLATQLMSPSGSSSGSGNAAHPASARSAPSTHQLLYHVQLISLLRKAQVFTDPELRVLVLRVRQRSWESLLRNLDAYAHRETSPYLYASRLLDLARDYWADLTSQYTMMFTAAPPSLPALHILPGVTQVPETGPNAVRADYEDLESDFSDESELVSDTESVDSSASVSPRVAKGTVSLQLAPLAADLAEAVPGECPLLHDLLYRTVHQLATLLNTIIPSIKERPPLEALGQQLRTLGPSLARLGLDFRPLVVPALRRALAETTT
ncbi:hypothetical protein IWQ60_009338 [Tieghemiomyces parasiticus]|uniref:Conserved oligomeric Golgi complex subunit 8 n=1 Tax=Tieghemiomyces parasiticus TaxID=78921 RepID=A0A9W7ZUD2_9FUNG|nr:hypothetical protein IWQ60_009338 [Tieghemiomyces parasiticus]